MKAYRLIGAALAALFLSTQVLATSHGDRSDRLKKDDAPAIYEYVL
jgi:hypothetical protein